MKSAIAVVSLVALTMACAESPVAPSASSDFSATSLEKRRPPKTEFGPGTYRVGKDIAPGRYFVIDPLVGCQFARLSKKSEHLADALLRFRWNPNGTAAAQWIVDILPTDAAFESNALCGTWSQTRMATYHRAPYPTEPNIGPFPPGIWLVPEQIEPGVHFMDVSHGTLRVALLSDFQGIPGYGTSIPLLGFGVGGVPWPVPVEVPSSTRGVLAQLFASLAPI